MKKPKVQRYELEDVGAVDVRRLGYAEVKRLRQKLVNGDTGKVDDAELALAFLKAAIVEVHGLGDLSVEALVEDLSAADGTAIELIALTRYRHAEKTLGESSAASKG